MMRWLGGLVSALVFAMSSIAQAAEPQLGTERETAADACRLCSERG